MITADVDRDISTANCWSSLGDKVDRVRVIYKLFCSAVIGVSLDQVPCAVTALQLLSFFIVGIQAVGLSIPLSLLMLSG